MSGLIAKCPVCGATEMHECGRRQFVCEVCGSTMFQRELAFTSIVSCADLNEAEVREPDVKGFLSIDETVANVTRNYYYE